MPNTILSLVVGYVFVKIFHFVALKQNTKNVEHILMQSLVIGFIICQIASLIPFSISYAMDLIGITCGAALGAYVLGRFVRSYYFLSLLDILKIRDSGNVYLWDDLMDNQYPFKVKIVSADYIYEGWAHAIESYSNNPHIALGAYVIKDKDENVLKNCCADKSTTIVVDISQALHVEIIYDTRSLTCKDIEYLCKLEKETEERN